MNNTAETLLALSEEDLIAEASKMQPKPWKHEEKPSAYPNRECVKCGKTATYHVNCEPYDKSDCTVPDPIKLDGNTAMEWRDKMPSDNLWEFITTLEKLWMVENVQIAFEDWALYFAQPRHYLIAAILAQEKK